MRYVVPSNLNHITVCMLESLQSRDSVLLIKGTLLWVPFSIVPSLSVPQIFIAYSMKNRGGKSGRKRHYDAFELPAVQYTEPMTVFL